MSETLGFFCRNSRGASAKFGAKFLPATGHESLLYSIVLLQILDGEISFLRTC